MYKGRGGIERTGAEVQHSDVLPRTQLCRVLFTEQVSGGG